MVYAFFQNCYHLGDWIVNDHLTTRTELNEFINANGCMQICADICNGSKHFFLRDSRSKLDISVIPVFEEIKDDKIKEMKSVFCICGIDWEPFSLATECVKEWDAFLETLERG